MGVSDKNSNIMGTKSTPRTLWPRANVNSNYKKKAHTAEQLDLWARQKALKSVGNVLTDLGDHVTRLGDDVILINTEVYKPDGDEIVLKIVQDKNGEPQQMVIKEQGTYLWEYIIAQDYPIETRRKISQMAREASSEKCAFSFDGKNIFVTGNKEDIVKMKWDLIGVLNKIYDEGE